jgi:hypothetical protein
MTVEQVVIDYKHWQRMAEFGSDTKLDFWLDIIWTELTDEQIQEVLLLLHPSKSATVQE